MKYVLKLKEEEFSTNYFKHFKNGLPKHFSISGKTDDVFFKITQELFEIQTQDTLIRRDSRGDYFIPVMAKTGVIDLQSQDKTENFIVGFIEKNTKKYDLFIIEKNNARAIKDDKLVQRILNKIQGDD